jgi:hypothetical protein
MSATDNGQIMLASGYDGTIVSHDSGLNFAPTLQESLDFAAISIDGERMAGLDGHSERALVYLSNDGGFSWDYVAFGSSDADIGKCLSSSPTLQNMAVGYSSSTWIYHDDDLLSRYNYLRVYVTQDYGASWKMTLNDSNPFMHVSDDPYGSDYSNFQMQVSVDGESVWVLDHVNGSLFKRRGENWAQVAGNYSTMALTPNGPHLVTILVNGTHMMSADYGTTWILRNPKPNAGLDDCGCGRRDRVSLSDDGQRVFSRHGGFSVDGGKKWNTLRHMSAYHNHIVSRNGVALTVGGWLGILEPSNVSLLGTYEWRTVRHDSEYYSMAYSADLKYMYATSDSSFWTSATNGLFWTGIDKGWTKIPNVLCSGDGQTVILWATGRTLNVSTDFGVTFHSVGKKMVWEKLAMTNNFLIGIGWDQTFARKLFLSRNYGTTWETIPEPTIDHFNMIGDSFFYIKGTELYQSKDAAKWTKSLNLPDNVEAVDKCGTVMFIHFVHTSIPYIYNGTDLIEKIGWTSEYYCSADNVHMIALADEPAVMTSSDKGQTWYTDNYFSTDRYYDFDFGSISKDGSQAILSTSWSSFVGTVVE